MKKKVFRKKSSRKRSQTLCVRITFYKDSYFMQILKYTISAQKFCYKAGDKELCFLSHKFIIFQNMRLCPEEIKLSEGFKEILACKGRAQAVSVLNS